MIDAEVVVDVETNVPLVTVASVDVLVGVGVPGVEIGVPGSPGPPGPAGPAGPTGLVKVAHGGDPNVARPTAPLVYWVGTVQPVNAQPDDLLMLKGA